MTRGARLGYARPRRRESGFALMLVFAMAAVVAVMLYIELPRVAFEAQRAREQTLIDRGQQYVRAIQLYMRKFPGKYPANIDQLENTNNVRFLRRRFKDPMTGSDEWRIIHAGPGGALTDSLVQKPPTQQQANQGGNSLFGSNMGSNIGTSIGTPIGSSTDTASSDSSNPVPSAVPRPRPSQMTGPTSMPGMPGSMMSGGVQPGQIYPTDQMPTDQPTAQYPGVVQPGQPVQFQPGQPSPFAGQPGQPGQPVQPGQPGQPFQPGQPTPFGQPVQPGQPYPNTQPGAQPGQPSYGQPGQPGYGPGIPGLPAPSGSASNPYGQNPYGQQPVVPVINPNDQQPPASSGPGTAPVPDLIRNQILGQRPQTGFGLSGQTIGGGIAGVATKLEATGIKVYNDRTKYNEWEFVYDPRKDMSNPLGGGMQGPLPQGPQPGFGSGPSATPPK